MKQLYPVSNDSSITLLSNKRLSVYPRTVIGIHGNARNAESLLDNLSKAANSDTLVVVPHFKTKADSRVKNEAYWTTEGWKQGDDSISAEKISSFTVLDHLIPTLGSSVVVAGHSAGGQFTQRYAIGNSLDHTIQNISYAVANPGSYMYLDAIRPVKPKRGCQFNEYKYGVEFNSDETSHYMYKSVHRNPLSTLIHSYLSRTVTYLLGLNDTGSEDLDTGCEANSQGPNRLARGKYYYESLNRLGQHNHSLVLLPGVGHISSQVYKTPEARKVLFGGTK